MNTDESKTLHALTMAQAEAVRAACERAAREAYEEAGAAGLCAEGRWERALDALRNVDLREVLQRR